MEITVPLSQFRRRAFEQLERVLRNRLTYVEPNEPARREPPEMLRKRTDLELTAHLRDLAEQIAETQPTFRRTSAFIDESITKMERENSIEPIASALNTLLEKIEARASTSPENDGMTYFAATLEAQELVLKPDAKSAISNSRVGFERQIEDLRFLSMVMQMCTDRRKKKAIRLSPADSYALDHAYSILDRLGRLPAGYAFIRTDEARPYQTYLSFADPGDGHLETTVQNSDLLKGLIVHIEHIDRDGIPDKSVVEAYRVPALRTAARVRLHVGLETPCTVFIGRPVFEGQKYDLGRLKAVHTIAGLCSSMFALGVADCKIAMDGLSAREAINFMQLIAGNVQRDPDRQKLSAAFNINTDLVDDREEFQAQKIVRSPYERAELAIDLTVKGHFDKIAWDGASTGPSEPILGKQLRSWQLLKVVHKAHSLGLETYISAGMLPVHMTEATFIGVGGVGIGMKLHTLVDGRPGKIDSNLVLQALSNRNDAADTPAGKAACHLARLDWDFHRGILPDEIDDLRRRLFQSLLGWNSIRSADNIESQSTEAILRPLAEQLEDYNSKILDQYPISKIPSSGHDDMASFFGEFAGTIAQESPFLAEPLAVNATRTLLNAKSPEIQDRLIGKKQSESSIRSALESKDWDRLRGMSKDLQIDMYG